MACTASTASVVGAAPSGADTADRAATAVAATTNGPLDNYAVQVGPEERIFGPSGLTDFPYFSERTPSGKLLGFISNNDSYSVASRNNKKLRSPRVILKRGRAGSFDKCGAWLIGSVYKRDSRWVALYHAEAAGEGDNGRCIFNDDSVVASVGRAVSHDAGRTWTKTGQVLTQDRDLTGPKSEDAAMGRLVKYGDYLYFFYAASDSNANTTRRLHVARSHVDDLGERGTWRKWHCWDHDPSILATDVKCDFGGTGNEGLGGDSDPIEKINPMARVIIPNTFLNRSIALHASGTQGFKLYVSSTVATAPPLDDADPASTDTAWTNAEPFYPPVSTKDDPLVDNWDRSRRAKQLYAYPSIVGASGESHTSGQTFFIYYVKLFPGGDFPERYLMRRKVTISEGAGVNRVALTTYVRRSDGRRRTSTERPIENAFKPKSGEGYLAGEDISGYLQVFECKKRKDYLLRTERCGKRERPVRRVGWIAPTRTGEATVPIYRCFNRAKKFHFASDSRRCDRLGRRETRLGYGLPSV